MRVLDLSVARVHRLRLSPLPLPFYVYFRLENFYKLSERSSLALVNQGGNREIEVASRAKLTTARGRGAAIDANVR